MLGVRSNLAVIVTEQRINVSRGTYDHVQMRSCDADCG